jgi:PAS domain S-box-containing protein
MGRFGGVAMKKKTLPRTIRIPVIYGIFSVLWIVITDQLNSVISTSMASATLVAMIKGLAFVLASTLLIFFLLRADEKHEASLHTELKVVQESFTYLFSRNPLPMWIIDPEDGRFLTVNTAACDLYGYSAEEFQNVKFNTLCDQAECAKLLDELKSEKESLQRSGPWKQIKRDGSVLFTELMGFPLQFSGRKVIMAAVLDLSQQRLMEEELKTTASQRDDYESFSYSISHDLRTPLRTVNGYGQILLDDYGEKLDAKGKDYLRSMVQASLDMNQMVDNLLMLTRLKRSNLHMESVDLSKVAHEVMDQLLLIEPQRKVDFHCVEHAVIYGDPALMKNLLTNLLENAWKFTSRQESPLIEFGSQPDPNKGTVFFVRDNGVGFDMHQADGLFKPFKRLHETSDFPGTGIGLSIVARIIERHHGNIWAESAVNKGSTFFFTIGYN